MSKTEVRRKDFAIYQRMRQLTPSPDQQWQENGSDGQLPATHITLPQAEAFCAWLTEHEQKLELLRSEESYRLPLDDEWSMAAGLPRELGDTPAQRHLRTRGFYPWGFDPKVQNANVWDSTALRQSPSPPTVSPPRSTAPGFLQWDDKCAQLAITGSYPANVKGFQDLSGNVWEWIQEPYGGDDILVRECGTLRGGSWRSTTQEELLSSYRLPLLKDALRDDIGFRIVLTNGSAARE
jgi:eukaryotic-like serine/threonine-protein kinase